MKKIDDIKVFEKAVWVWAKGGNNKENDYVVFRRKFPLEKPPKTAIARIGCESSYNLFINDKLAVFAGGMARESANNGGYYDEIDIAPFLVKGDNVLAFECNYLGVSGGSSFDAGGAGLIFECESLDIHSDATFFSFRSAAYSVYDAIPASGLYAGHSLIYDATREGQIDNIYTAAYESNIFEPSDEFGAYLVEPWNQLVKRTVPMFVFSKPLKAKARKVGGLNEDVYTANLNGAYMIAPTFTITAKEGTETIEIYTDRYKCSGAWGDENKSFYNQKLQYICKNGKQTFALPFALAGTKIIISMPSSVKLNKLTYRTTAYDTKTDATVDVDSLSLPNIVTKAIDTIKVCMRDSFWNSPDRDRAANLLELSAIGSLYMYTFDDEAMALVKKSIYDILNFRENDILYSKPLGVFREDIPSYGLVAFSQRGIIADYFNRTGDKETLKDCFGPIKQYLALWEMNSDGLVNSREGDKKIFDSGFNIDEKVLENALYYSACKFAIDVANTLGKKSEVEDLEERAESIKANFDSAFLKGGAYTSTDFYDERANAWAVITGLAASVNYYKISQILASVQNCSPMFEQYVMDAICITGYQHLAVKRINNRFRNFDYSSNPTLSEDFFVNGALSYSGSGAVVSNLYRNFCGLTFEEGISFSVTPDLSATSNIKFYSYAQGGSIKGNYKRNGSKVEIVIDNSSVMQGVLKIKSALLGLEGADKELKLNKGRNKYTL